MKARSAAVTLRCRILLVLCLVVTPSCVGQSAEEAMQKFYRNEGAEDTLMDPLILAGDKVVPAVAEAVKNKEMPRRRYAIQFLGNISHKEALPTLEAILNDATEQDYFRADALQAIYQIDQLVAARHARTLRERSDLLGKVSQDLLADRKMLPERRTYAQALMGRHN